MRIPQYIRILSGMTTYGADRDKRVELRMTHAEKQGLEMLAAKCGLSVSDTIRQLVRERYAELTTEAA